jgi:hypothetical protein
MPEPSRARLLLVLSLALLLNGCATGRAIPVGRFLSIDPPLKTIALAPSGGIFADLIGLELPQQGYTVVDTGATAALLVFIQKPQDDLLSSETMAVLKERGIDAVLVVQKVEGTDGHLQTVRLRLHSTALSSDVGGVNWENGWIRRGLLESAQEIAAAMHRDSRPSDAVGGDEQRATSSNDSEY